MKELIRSILKEEVSQTNNPKFNKLMKIFVSAMKQEFPFVTGWVAKDDPDEGDKSSVYVDLVVDLEKVKEYYNLPYEAWYGDINFRNEIMKDERSWAYPFSLLNVGTLDKWELFQPFNDYAKFVYNEIPNHLKPTYTYESIFDDAEKQSTKSLDIDAFVIK
jgi:hypothetical protein